MLDHAREAVGLAAGKRREDLDADRTLNLALVRLCEIIGEAASRVPLPDRERMPQIRWRGFVGLRNRLIHAYEEVNFDILWEIVSTDLPSLIESLEKTISAENAPPT